MVVYGIGLGCNVAGDLESVCGLMLVMVVFGFGDGEVILCSFFYSCACGRC